MTYPHRTFPSDYRVPDAPASPTLPPMPATPATASALSTAAAKAAAWIARRDTLIRQAVTEGGSLREVAALAGLSHTAVALICRKTP